MSKQAFTGQISYPPLMVLLAAVFTLGGCGGGNETPASSTANAVSDAAPMANTGLAGTDSSGTAVSSLASTNTQPPKDPTPAAPDTVQYPTDIDSDDHAGMIVTGLGGLDPRLVTSPWFVNIGTFREASLASNRGDAFVDLVEYTSDFPVANHIAFYKPALDTCEIVDPNRQAVDNGSESGGKPPPTISGGASVVFNTPSGPWHTFNQSVLEGGDIGYRAKDQLLSELPNEITLSVPGDAFPTVAAHPLFEPAAPVRLLPATKELVETETHYSWVPGSAGLVGSFIQLQFLAYDASHAFQGFVAKCDLADDGSFTLPAALLDYLSDNSHARLTSRFSRTYSRIDLANGVVIRQRMMVAE